MKHLLFEMKYPDKTKFLRNKKLLIKNISLNENMYGLLIRGFCGRSSGYKSFKFSLFYGSPKFFGLFY